MIVAVLDTGCDADHVQFNKRKVDFKYYPPDAPQYPRSLRGFDTHGHGTHVCGIIAGKSVGVAPDVELMVASVIESETVSTSLKRIVAALEWVASTVLAPGNEEKAAILNMSLGFTTGHLKKDQELLLMAGMRGLLQKLQDEYEVLPLVAIGNEEYGNYRFPGAFPEVIGVGAVDSELNPTNFSGGGELQSEDGEGYTKPDLVGYGESIYSSFQRNIDGHSRYALKSGTSMATPYVAGVAALLAQKYQVRGAKLREVLLQKCLKIGHAEERRVGHGLAVYS